MKPQHIHVQLKNIENSHSSTDHYNHVIENLSVGLVYFIDQHFVVISFS